MPAVRLKRSSMFSTHGTKRTQLFRLAKHGTRNLLWGSGLVTARKVEPSRARSLAEKHAPIIIQGYKSPYDAICPINMGEFIPTLEPVVYYSVKQDDDYFYCLYCVYHYKDWCDPDKLGGYLRVMLDSHRHDFEGVLIAVPKFGVLRRWMACVFHNELKFYTLPYEAMGDTIAIEAEGHGIVNPKIEGCYVPRPFLNYGREYRLFNMNTARRLDWLVQKVQLEFNENKVHMPWQWNHWKINRKCGRKTDGLIYRDPARLLKLARKCSLI